LMDFLKGMHHARRFHSSERPRKERQVKFLGRLEFLNRARPELDALTQMRRAIPDCQRNVVGVGIERDDARGLIGVQPRQTAIAAADFEHVLARQAAGKIKQRGRFVAFRVKSDRHELIPEPTNDTAGRSPPCLFL